MTLHEFLIEKALTQQAFADMIGAKQSSVSKWLQGDSRPSWAMIRTIKEITKGSVTADSFLDIPDFMNDEDAA